MNGFIINIEKDGAPLELYAEQLSALPDANGYIRYLIRGDWQVARVYVHVARYRAHQFQAPAEVEAYYEDIHYVRVAAFSHDPWLPAAEVKAIGEAIGERIKIGNHQANRVS